MEEKRKNMMMDGRHANLQAAYDTPFHQSKCTSKGMRGYTSNRLSSPKKDAAHNLNFHQGQQYNHTRQSTQTTETNHRPKDQA